MLIVENKKGNLAIAVDSIENINDDMKGRLTIVYHQLETDTGTFSKTKGQLVSVRKDESFETLHVGLNQRLIGFKIEVADQAACRDLTALTA